MDQQCSGSSQSQVLLLVFVVYCDVLFDESGIDTNSVLAMSASDPFRQQQQQQ
jgi:hypothetical protein